MPFRFSAFEETILGDMQKILYISDAMSRPGYEDVVGPPPTKLQQMVRHQFITSIYKTLSGAVENAEKNKKLDESGIDDPDGLTVPVMQGGSKTDSNIVNTQTADRVSYDIESKNHQVSNIDTERPPTTHAQQHKPSASRSGASIDFTVRVLLLNQVYGRIQADPRCTQANRRPPIPGIRQAYNHTTSRNYHSWHILAELAAYNLFATHER
jgi:hypothetical protein